MSSTSFVQYIFLFILFCYDLTHFLFKKNIHLEAKEHRLEGVRLELEGYSLRHRMLGGERLLARGVDGFEEGPSRGG